MSGGMTSRGGVARAGTGVRRELLDAADRAWVLLLPVAVVAVPLIALLAPLGGRLLLPDPGYHYWIDEGVRKPAVDVGYALVVIVAIAYGAAVVATAQLRLTPPLRRTLVAVAQIATVAVLLVGFLAQRSLTLDGVRRSYFTPATLLVAAVATVAAGVLARSRRGSPERAPRALPRWTADGRVVRIVCLGAAVLATVVFVLPAVHTDDAPSDAAHLGALFYDEATAVLNGRSTLVDMVAYGNLWPYVTLGPLHVFGDSYASFTTMMATITAFAMLAVYGVLRRVVGRPPLALALYLPVLATGFFTEQRIVDDRYTPGTYFGMFPLRYAGPYLLAWLTAWQLSRDPDERWTRRLLFAAGGLVALNNVDFGAAALAATVLAGVVGRPPRDRRALGALALDVATGLALALAAVSALTLAREGSLPHLELIVRYGRLFVNGGFGNLPLPALGFHLVVTATFVAAVAVAAVRASRARGGDLLAAMLAWCALFGFGASVYFYYYRSLPDVLINLFSIWGLTLALLVVAALRDVPRSRRVPSVSLLVVTFGFALAVCSLGQTPSPLEQVRRIAASAPPPGAAGFGPADAVPAGGFRQTAAIRVVAARTRPGEAVAIISPLGHRIARGAGVVSVAPYTGLEQIVAREQLDEIADLLRREGGEKLYVTQPPLPGVEAELGRLGFRLSGRWQIGAWPEPTISEYSG